MFCRKTFGYRIQTISSVTSKKRKKKKENVLAHDFVDKTLCEERGPPLNSGALVNFITPWDLLHTLDPFIDSHRFIDESSRNSESLIYAIIIPRIEKLGTVSACRLRQ